MECRDVAIERVKAALAACEELRAEGMDLVLVARTDCRNAAEHGGFDEALARCQAFASLGAEVVYAEGLAGEEEMRALNVALASYGCHTMLAQVHHEGTARTAGHALFVPATLTYECGHGRGAWQ